MKLKMFSLAILINGLFLLQPGAAQQASCTSLQYDQNDYTLCTANPKRDDIRLFWKGTDGKPFAGFQDLRKTLSDKNLRLAFAMNAGMFEHDLSPVGLYIENGKQFRSANLRKGPGNFHMMPNGVFYVADGKAGVLETERYLATRINARFATQSGPMLVIDGKLHPRIRAEGVSRKLRNGVGIDKNGMVHFVISDNPVTFYAFARLFRDKLNCDNALFLDGSISSIYAANLDKTTLSFRSIGPIVGVVTRQKD